MVDISKTFHTNSFKEADFTIGQSNITFHTISMIPISKFVRVRFLKLSEVCKYLKIGYQSLTNRISKSAYLKKFGWDDVKNWISPSCKPFFEDAVGRTDHSYLAISLDGLLIGIHRCLKKYPQRNNLASLSNDKRFVKRAIILSSTLEYLFSDNINKSQINKDTAYYYHKNKYPLINHLSLRHKRFCLIYTITSNATKSYLLSYGKSSSARQCASKLLHQPLIKRCIKRLYSLQTEKIVNKLEKERGL